MRIHVGCELQESNTIEDIELLQFGSSITGHGALA